MAIPPTRVTFVTPAVGYGSTASPKTTPTFNVTAGDLLTVTADTEDSTYALNTPTASGGSVTWTLQESFTSSSNCTAYVWTGAVGATATGITVSVTRVSGAGQYGFGVTVWRSHGGVGVHGQAAATGGPSLALTCSANSAVACTVGDWNAADGTTRTWRTINGSAMAESLYFRDAAHYTAYSGYSTDVGTAGSKTLGLSAPTGAKYAIVGVEILGTSGSSFSGSATVSGSGTLTFAGTPAIPGSAGLSGSGTLTFSGKPNLPGSVGMSGSGSLGFTATPAIPGTVATSGSGTLTLVGTPVYVGSIALSGGGTLTFTAVPSPTGSAGLSGSGGLTFGATPSITGALTLSGVGVLTGSGVVGGGGSNFSGMVMLTGSGSLGTSATPAFASVVALGGQGILTISTAGRTMYRFETPGRQMSMDPTGKDFLWSKVKYFEGDAVIKYLDGSFRRVTVFRSDEPNVDKVYLGGHVHTISDAEALLLIQAGYGEYLTVVTG